MPRSIPLCSLVQTLDHQEHLDSARASRGRRGARDLRALPGRALPARGPAPLLCWLPNQSSALHEHGPSVDGSELPVDRIVLCAGAETAPEADALWKRLLARGQAVADPLGLGVQKRADHSVISLGSRSLWALGGQHGQLAAPTDAELALQARELALTLVTQGLPFPRLVHEPYTDT
jgi:hypothetical protein